MIEFSQIITNSPFYLKLLINNLYYYKIEVGGSDYDIDICDFSNLTLLLLFWAKRINWVRTRKLKVENIIFNY